MSNEDDDATSNLSPEETEKLLHFQELTGIEDITRCRGILLRYNWDLEVAIQSHLSEDEGLESAFNPSRSQVLLGQQRIPDVDINPPDQSSLLSPAQRRRGNAEGVVYQPGGVVQGVLGWISTLLLLPFQFTYSTLASIFNFLYSFFRPDPRQVVSDPVGDVASFINDFEQRYGEVHPAWNPITYSQVLNEAKQYLRFVFVYLHSSQHADTERFCRFTLCNNAVVDFINANMMCWACDVNSPEGYRVARALRASNYPFVALIVLRDNRMTVVARSEEFVDGDTLRQRLGRIMQSNEASLDIARAEREERDFNQSLRQEQDFAYNESLRADKEKERRRREQLEREKEEEEEARRESLNEEQRRQELLRNKDVMRSQLPDEPPMDGPDIIKILLKLPNGVRLERRFHKYDSMELLYNYVFVHEAAPDDFEIVTSYPRKVVPCQPTPDNPVPPSFQEFGLGKAEMLFVHDNQA